MNKRLFSRLRKSDRGVSMIEFALVIPILLFLILGLIEFGWIYNGYITLNGAAREGARIASIKKALPGDGYIEAEVLKHATNTLQNVSAEVIYPVLASGGGQNYTYGVKVKANGTITPLIGFYVTGDFPLSAEVTMRIQ